MLFLNTSQQKIGIQDESILKVEITTELSINQSN